MKQKIEQLLLTIVCLSFVAQAFAADKKPNIIFILTDNHGAWTLGWKDGANKGSAVLKRND